MRRAGLFCKGKALSSYNLSVIANAMPLPGLRLPASASLPLASCWPRPQQLLPVSATGGGRRRCKKGAARPFQTPKGLSKPKNASRFAKRIFLCFSHLRLRRRFHVSAGRYRQQRGNTCCEAANRRNEKKALSAATSFFPFRLPLRDYQGRVALDSCLPRLESSGCFSGSLLARKRELNLA